MIEYTAVPHTYLNEDLPSFIRSVSQGSDLQTVESFGAEWHRFHNFDKDEIEEVASKYFHLVEPFLERSTTSVLDVGCGTGRWSAYLASRVRHIDAVDPSQAVFVAQKLNKNNPNVRVCHSGVEELPFADETFDLVIALGVLHHIPDTARALRLVSGKARPGGKVLVYLYYNFENRGPFFKALHKLSELLRFFISKKSERVKVALCDLIALVIYLPAAKFSLVVKKLLGGDGWRRIPLSFYADRSFYIMRNDSLDRFGTPLEQRFSRDQIEKMMSSANLTDVVFSETEPFWCAVGTKQSPRR